MSTGEIILIVVVLIIVLAVMFKYKAIEAAIFDNGTDDYEPIGDISLKLCIAIGAVIGIVAFVGEMFTNRSPGSLGFSNIWGILFNGLPYVAFLTMSVSVYNVIMAETSIGRMIGRSLFVIVACLIGAFGGVVASVLAILAIFLYLIIAFALKVFFGMNAPTPSMGNNKENEEVLKITDEHGYERILKDIGMGKYKDDKGDRWRSSGYGTVERDID